MRLDDVAPVAVPGGIVMALALLIVFIVMCTEWDEPPGGAA
jgi:hypothetical protein